MKHAASLFVRRHHWVIQVRTTKRGDGCGRPSGRKRQVVEVLKSPLVLTRTFSIPADCTAIRIYASAVDAAAGSTKILLQTGGKKLDEEPLATGGDPLNPPKERYWVDKEFRGRELRLEMVVTPSKPGLRWTSLGRLRFEETAEDKARSRRDK